MEELFSSNLFAIYIIACIAVITYTNFEENQRMFLLYLFTVSFPNVTNNHFTYSGERLNQGGITYLNVGDIPHEAYKIMVTGCDNKIYRFWPRVVDGVDPQGTLFEKSTGKKLGTDADVVVGKPYYLLTRGIIAKKVKHIKVEEICRKTISWNTWRVYQVEALDYDEKTARFFLDYHCRLTEHPIEIHPIWPVSIQYPYVVKHCDNRLTIYFKGNATAHVFPETRVTAFHNSTVREVICTLRQEKRTIKIPYLFDQRLFTVYKNVNLQNS